MFKRTVTAKYRVVADYEYVVETKDLISCSVCFSVEEQSRKGFRFICIRCGHKDHADVNGAKIISHRGAEKAKAFNQSSLRSSRPLCESDSAKSKGLL